MENSARLKNIMTLIKDLDEASKRKLVNRLGNQLQKAKPKSITHTLVELNALGAEVWKNINPDDYVQQERQWD